MRATPPARCWRAAAAAGLRGLLALLALLLGACATPPRSAGAPPPSAALQAGPDSALARRAAALLDGAAAGDSALVLLPVGGDALAARLHLVEEAERSVDLQVYIYRPDASGTGLAAALWAAAERGVRVRLLLDDWGARPDDATLQRLATHPRIAVRLFNPLAHPQSAVLSLLLDFDRAQRRMHNKLMVADGRAAIVGGRNVGDEYFARRREFEFGDVDALVAGPAVDALAAGFDAYWNDALTVEVLPPAPGTPAAAGTLPEPVAEVWRAARDGGWAAQLQAGALARYHGPVSVLQDRPSKLDPDAADATDAAGRGLGAELARVIGQVRDELLIVSPYFVPGDGGVRQLRELAHRGVRVTVVTNTLAATDVPAVHAGYARHRRELLAAGIALYEVRPDAPRGRRDATGGRGGSGSSARLSLHAKMMVVDRRLSFIGSMNIDPRSLRLNTENGIVVASAALAADLDAGVRRSLVDDAWRLALDADGRLVWHGLQDGTAVTRGGEPGAGWWPRLQAWLLRLLPIEHLL